MSGSSFPPIFDGHNDTILSLTGVSFGGAPRQPRGFFERSELGHIDLPRAREGGLGGGFFAVLNRSPESKAVDAAGSAVDSRAGMEAEIRNTQAAFDPATGWPEAMPLDYAQSDALRLLGLLFKLERESNGQCKIIRSAAELQDCLDNGVFAILLHFEGADPLDPEGNALDVFSQAGVRSVGITHFRRNRYAEGVPNSFPGTPDTGPGLTDDGRELVRQCNQLRILIDLSHANLKTFWDIADLSDAPLVATHSNAWALSNCPRNLTDEQLEAVRRTSGMVGLNYHVQFLRSDGERDQDTPISVMADHIDYLVDKVGIDGVGLGSDFDGAIMPHDLRDAAGLPRLMEELAARGYDDRDLMKLAHGNWVRVLRETWGS